MTGLDVENDALVEVGVLVTDADLNILGSGVEFVIKPGDESPAGALENMNDFVRSMHEASGLLPDIEHGVSMDYAQEQVLRYIKKYVPVAGKAQLGGNSVGMDKRFLERYMPEVMAHLHYRVIDVSTIKELASRWYPAARHSAPAKTGNHRALGDIIMIICDKPKEMAKEISDLIDRGSTYLKAVGSYTDEERNVVMCACRTKEVHTVRQAAKKLDPNSFVIILDSNEVAGEGFRHL